MLTLVVVVMMMMVVVVVMVMVIRSGRLDWFASSLKTGVLVIQVQARTTIKSEQKYHTDHRVDERAQIEVVQTVARYQLDINLFHLFDAARQVAPAATVGVVSHRWRRPEFVAG